MSISSSRLPIACLGVGSELNSLSCCYPDKQTSTTCYDIFALNNSSSTLSRGCQDDPLNCIGDCANESLLYTSHVQDDQTGNGRGPIARYQACINLPSIARSSESGILAQNLSAIADKYIAPNTTDIQLQQVTSAVTDCLSSTCRNARRSDLCYDDYCSPVKLLANSTSPNITAVNQCLHVLCSGGYKSLPYANADIIGVGVYSSYILQCIFIVVLWIGFLLPFIWRLVRSRAIPPYTTPAARSTHKELAIDLLNEFHKAQCFFSVTLMIASFTQTIYDTDMLTTFMIVPLATNGIVPVIFAYLLLAHYQRVHLGTTLYTMLTYTLSSIVYWTLYAHVSSLGPSSQQSAYQQFMFKLSAIPACGGYSALAVCPRYVPIGLHEVIKSSVKIRVLTPILWTFSTAVLLALIALQVYEYRQHQEARAGKAGYIKAEKAEKVEENVEENAEENAHSNRNSWALRSGFAVMIAIMLACQGMQLSTLAIGRFLNMMDPYDWSFGQIIAITVWTPPMLEYVFAELSVWRNRKEKD